MENNYFRITKRQLEIKDERIKLIESTDRCLNSIKIKKAKRLHKSIEGFEFNALSTGILNLKEMVTLNQNSLKMIKSEEKSLNLLSQKKDKDLDVLKYSLSGKNEEILLKEVVKLKDEYMIDSKNFKISKMATKMAAEFAYRLEEIINNHK
jgi:hypothetical protein